MTFTTQAPRRTRVVRLVGVDAARGLALIGMMAVHITPPVGADGEVTTAYLLASGRASALFAILAGVGLALASGGRTPPRGRALVAAGLATAARAAVLAVIGLALGGLDSGVAVILVYYGLLFIVAIPFLGLGPAVLLPLAAVWAIGAPLVSHAIRAGMLTETRSVPNFGSLADPGVLLTELTLTGYYPVLPWTAYILFGLGLGRLNLRSARTAATVSVSGAVLAVAAKVVSWWLLESGGMDELRAAGAGTAPIARYPLDASLQAGFFGTTPTTSWWWEAVSAPHSGAPLDLLHTMGVAAGVLGLMLLLAIRARAMLWPVAAIGGMTLSLYTLHVVLLSSALPRETSDALLWHIIVALVVAAPWRTLVGRGPLEIVAHRASTNARRAITGDQRDVPLPSPG